MGSSQLGPWKAPARVLAGLCAANWRDVADRIGASFSCCLLPAARVIARALQDAGKNARDH
eukprot:4018608-Pyramimonas_sp.AAC.1